MDQERKILGLAVFVGLCFGAAAISGVTTAAAVADWYPTLSKPSWNPPSWVFGPVWSALYLAMAVAAWLVWLRRKDVEVRFALGFFAVQLLLNALWSPLFFGLRSPGLGFADIVLLWLALVPTTAAFFRVSRPAGWLFVPYLLWTTFAAALNFAIWRLN
jgi:tryptophan-rich sensory protein